MKRCFFVVGPESTGTRMLTSLFVNNGIKGEATHSQKLDLWEKSGFEESHSMCPRVDNIVWRRSIPHGEEFPNLYRLWSKLLEFGYHVVVLITTRNYEATIQSAVNSFEAIETRKDAVTRYHESYRWIFKEMDQMDPNWNWNYHLISYEQLIYEQGLVIEFLNKEYELNLKPINTVNQNIKYSKHLTASVYGYPMGALCTQSSMEGTGYNILCNGLLKESPRFHRKQWEFVYILDMLKLHNLIRPGVKGLGFGCGKERIVPVFAKHDMSITATDLSFSEAQAAGWTNTNQHMSGPSSFYEFVPVVCSREDLEKLTYLNVDMNNIPHHMMQMEYDFVWSSCSLEHLGTIDKALQFILSTVHCLKPGGVSVHTTEFNLSSNDDTLDSGPTVILRKKDFDYLATELKKIDAELYPISYDPGTKELDVHYDVPPYLGSGESRHLKLQIDRWKCTSIGFCIRRKT